MVFFSLFFLFFCPPISLMDLATWRRSCHGIADRMVAPRPGPLASHRPQAQLVADASPPAIPWACLAHYWSACCFWNPPPLRGSATHNFHRHRSTKTWGRLPARPAPTPPTSIPSARYPAPSPFLFRSCCGSSVPPYSGEPTTPSICLFVCFIYGHHHKLTD